MKKHSIKIGFFMASWVSIASALPEGFVYLHDIDSTIMQDIRYAGYHNFVGRPINGYRVETCILTLAAAEQLKLAQAQLMKMGLSLKVYDCYRPQMAVTDFYEWSLDPKQQQMKPEFYPRTEKSTLFESGYIAKKSGHSRGSTVDLTIVQIGSPPEAAYKPGQPLVACYAPYNQRYRDNSINMGSGYDCLDEVANVDYLNLADAEHRNRMLLQYTMQKNGFQPYFKEWWHFTLKNEPYPKTLFNFPVE